MSNILKIVLGRASKQQIHELHIWHSAFYSDLTPFKGIIPRHFSTTIRTGTASTTPEDTNKNPITTREDDEPISIQNPYKKEQRKCILCRMNIDPDYKNVRLLSQFQSAFTGRIYGRHITGLCKKKQNVVERAIVKSQVAGFMPTYHKVIDYVNDPRLYDPDRPIRPHKY